MASDLSIALHVTHEGHVKLYRWRDSERIFHEQYWTTADEPNDEVEPSDLVKSLRGLSLEEKAHVAVSVSVVHRARADVQRALARHVLEKAGKHTPARENALVGELGAPLDELRKLLRSEAYAVGEAPATGHVARELKRGARAAALVEVVRIAFEEGRVSPLDEGAAQIVLATTGKAGRKEASDIRKRATQLRDQYLETNEIPAGVFGLWVSTHYACPTMSPIGLTIARILANDVIRMEQRVEMSATSQPRAPSMMRLPVDVASSRAMTGIAGGGVTTARTSKKEKKANDRVVGMTFEWENGKKDEIKTQLELQLYDGALALTAVRKRYGSIALKHLQTAIMLHWVSYVESDQSCYWWPELHLAVQKDGATSVRLLREKMRVLEASRLTTFYADGGQDGPDSLLRLDYPQRNKRGALISARLSLHPVFTRAIHLAYWPTSLKLIQSTGDDDVSAFAVILGQQFRMEHVRRGKDGDILFRKKARALCEIVGIPWRSNREKDARATKRIQQMMCDAMERGVIGSWGVKGNENSPDAVWMCTPAPASLERLVKGQELKRPRFLPRTGHELEQFVNTSGVSKKELAERIGVHPRTIRNGMALGGRALPGRLMVKLMQELWNDKPS